METLIINVPERKSSLVKQLLKELGVTIQNPSQASLLADEINRSIKPGKKPTMNQIVEEVKFVRSTKQ